MKQKYDFETLLKLIDKKRNSQDVIRFLESLSEVESTVDIEMEEEHIEFKTLGFGFYFESGKLVSIYIHSGNGQTGYSKYANQLPFGVSFNMSKDDVINTLGVPQNSGGGKVASFGKVLDWIKYNKTHYTIHFQFFKSNDTIKEITLAPLND